MKVLSGTYRTPLQYAASGGHVEVVMLLLSKGANPSLLTNGISSSFFYFIND